MSITHPRSSRGLSIVLAAALGLSALVAAPIAATVTAQPAAAATAPVPLTSSPFVSAPSKKIWYRIPALAVSHGKVYAFAERRNSATSDSGNFDVDMAVSSDNGHSWRLTPQLIGKSTSGQVSNPTATVAADGTVLLFVTVARTWSTKSGPKVIGTLELFTSKNNFTSPVTVFDPHIISGRAGPGNGIVLTGGAHAGRIMVPMSYQSGTSYGARFAISDDNGRTWTFTNPILDAAGTSLIEGQIAQVGDNKIFVSYHQKVNSAHPTPTNKSHYYLYVDVNGRAVSGWKALSVRLTTSQVSFLTVGRTLFMVTPSFTTSSDPTLRRVEAVYASTNGGASWSTKPYQLDLDNVTGAYSSIVKLDANTVGILYETGVKSYRERERFVSLRTSTLTSWTKVVPTIKHGKLSRSGVKVTIKAKGATSPWGTVSIYYTNTKTHKTGHVTRTLQNTSKGVILMRLPTLKHGKYSVKVTYNGTGRIAKRTVSVGSVTIR